LAGYDNVFMLPHIGSSTGATRDAMVFRALDNLDEFFAGKQPRDLLLAAAYCRLKSPIHWIIFYLTMICFWWA